MGLSAAEWETKVNALPTKSELRRLIMLTDGRGEKTFPDGLNGWRGKKEWQTLLRIYMDSERNVEHLDFLEDVDAFNNVAEPRDGRVGRPTRQDLMDEYIKENSVKSINISDPLRNRLAEALEKGDDSTVKAALEAADREVTALISPDAYAWFQTELRDTVQPAWAKMEAQAAGKAEVTLVSAEVHEFPASEDVDNWNAKALKALNKNTPTEFFQSGVLVIVTNTAAGVSPPGVGWMQQQGFVTGTVTKRGGLFSTATVLATGVRNKFDFEGALRAAVPDLQIKYPESGEPKAKVSAFGRK